MGKRVKYFYYLLLLLSLVSLDFILYGLADSAKSYIANDCSNLELHTSYTYFHCK